MTRRAKPDPALSREQKLSVLETELAKATEDFRLAKLAAKEAKAYAKIVKKEMKRVRRAWMAAQEEQDKAASAAARKKAKAASKARAKTKAAVSPKARLAQTPGRLPRPQ